MILEIAAIVFVLVLLFVAYVIGLNIGYRAGQEDAEIEFEIEDDDTETPIHHNKSQMEIVIEKHNDMFFVYDAETSKFLAHGLTKEQMEHRLVERFPNVRFAASEENLKEVGFI